MSFFMKHSSRDSLCDESVYSILTHVSIMITQAYDDNGDWEYEAKLFSIVFSCGMLLSFQTPAVTWNAHREAAQDVRHFVRRLAPTTNVSVTGLEIWTCYWIVPQDYAISSNMIKIVWIKSITTHGFVTVVYDIPGGKYSSRRSWKCIMS